MIFYFSGTGNSQWVAETLSLELNDVALSVPVEMNKGNREYSLEEGERLGFVFPVYSWGMPQFMETFIRSLNVENVSYLYMVCTCGDDIGLTTELFSDIVQAKGWALDLAYSVQMPNTYVCMPGFDVDSKEVVLGKKSRAVERLNTIIEHIKANDKVVDVVRGGVPWMKSKVIRPLFNKYLVTSKYFKVLDKCVGCGKCCSECPMANISLNNDTNKPRWQDNCVGCLRCYHSCPVNAIQFGAFTKEKGQYRYEK